MGITALADPEFGDNLRGLMSDFVHDAPDTFKNAAIDMMKLMVLPEGREQIILREAMGGDAALAELKLLGDRFAEASERGDEVAKLQIQKELESLVEKFSEKGLKEVEKYVKGQQAVVQGLMKEEPFFGQMFGMIETFNLAAAAADRAEAVRQERAKMDGTFAGKPPTAGDINLGGAFNEMVKITHDNLGRVAERIQEAALSNIEGTSEKIKDGLITPIEIAAGATTNLATEVLKIPAAIAGVTTGVISIGEAAGDLRGVVLTLAEALVKPLSLLQGARPTGPISRQPNEGELRNTQRGMIPPI